MPDFLSADNLCGQHLLRLVARGSAIIAELLRLSQNIPGAFSGDAEADPEQRRYLPLLFDFAYLKEPEEHERRVNASTELLDLDHEFLMNHAAILERFYQLFLSIFKYQRDFCKFVADVQKGIFIQHSMDDILLDTDGKQLMCEALYLYGVMLLLLEQKIPGNVRERMVVAFYRSAGESNLEEAEQVCKLCRSTGYVPGQRKPKNYPENYFSRFPLPQQVVRLVIGRLQSDDVYLMSTTFPSPEHRSTRLANQAAMLYVLLYFAPDILHKERATMRELVDKHFSDNWIISLYMGTIVDLTEEWAAYPAAKSALDNVISLSQVEQLQRQNAELIQSCHEELRRYLVEGVILKEYVVDNVETLLNCVRNCNVALRWRLLHRRTSDRRFREIIVDRGLSAELIINFLLKVSHLEYILKDIMQNLLDARAETWETGKTTCADRIMELADYYTGEKALTRVKRDENLMRYFAALAEQIRSLSLEEGHTTATGRKIQKIILALEDVEQFEQLDTDVQVKAFLHETRNILLQMIRTVNVKQEVLSIIENSSDLSYAWQLLRDYVDVFHRMIRQDPSSVVLLRAAFLKLASILDVPMIRITMCESPDQESVAEYYSSELVEFVREVMEVIPRSVFEYLLQIVDIQTKAMRPLPVRFEAKDLKEYAQLDQRYNMASLTHQVSIFTEGILVMERTLLGVIQVEPRKILEDGLRKELVRQVARAMHNILSINMQTADEIKTAMVNLAQCLDGFKRSIEYVQDYIDLAGLKIWQEEIARIINYNVEQECNRYVKRKIFDNQSRFQSRAIPIPRFPVPENDTTGAINFMGRIMSALLYLTDSTKTIYAPECSGWYSATGEEVCGIRTFALLNNSISVIGLRGLDTLFSFRIVHELNLFLKFYQDEVQPQRTLLEIIREALFPEEKIPPQATKLYANAMKKVEKLMLPLLKTIRKIGQAQLIRRQIAKVLEFSCRLDANLLFQALSTLDEALVRDVMNHYRDPERFPYPPDDNPLLEEFVKLSDACGLSDPMSKVYITSPPLEGLPILLMLFVLSYMPKLEYDKDFGTLVRKKPVFPLDGAPLVVGFATLLKQFHPLVTKQVLAYLGQFVRGTMYSMLTADSKLTTMPGEVLNTLIFMEQLCNYAQIPRTVVHAFVPPYIFDTIRFSS